MAVNKKTTARVAAALFLMTLALYLYSMRPGASWGDSPDFTVAAHGLGVAHPTGYPLTTLLGRAALWVPVGGASFRSALLSVIPGALAVAAFFVAAVGLGAPSIAAVAASAWFASSGFLWRQTGGAEVYALSAACALCMIAIALGAPGPRRTALFCFFSAICVGNHAGTGLAAVLIGIFLLATGWRAGAARRPHVALFAGLAGLTLYAALPLFAARGPAADWAHAVTPARFFTLVSGREFNAIGHFSVGSAAVSAIRIGVGLVRDTRWIGLFLAFVGLFASIAKPAARGLVAALAVAFFLLPILYYPTPEKESFFLPGYAALLLLAALGAAALVGWRPGVSPARALPAALILLAVAAASARLSSYWCLRSADDSAMCYASAAAQSARRDALVVMDHADDDPLAAVQALRAVEGLRPDLFFEYRAFLEMFPVYRKTLHDRAARVDAVMPRMSTYGDTETLAFALEKANAGKIPVYANLLRNAGPEEVRNGRAEGVLFRLNGSAVVSRPGMAAAVFDPEEKSELMRAVGAEFFADRARVSFLAGDADAARRDMETAKELNMKVSDWLRNRRELAPIY